MRKSVLSLLTAALLAGPVAAQTGAAPVGGGVTRAEMEQRVRAAFARADANRDGFLTREEARAGLNAARADRRNAPRQSREQRFARLDANRDRSISRAEFFARQEFGERRARRPGGAAGLGERMFAAVDADRDGRISSAELVDARVRRFERLDANKDGRVTPDERRAFRDARRAARG